MISTLPRRRQSVLLFRFDYTWPKFLPAVPTVNTPPKSVLPMRERYHRLGGLSRERQPVRVAAVKFAGNRRPHGWPPRNPGRVSRIRLGKDRCRSVEKSTPKPSLAARHLRDIAQSTRHRTPVLAKRFFLPALSKDRSEPHAPSIMLAGVCDAERCGRIGDAEKRFAKV